MKRIVLILVLAFVVGGGLFAVDWKSYPDSIQPGNFLINVGVGLGEVYGDAVIPPLSLIVDYGLPIGGLPFTVGGMFSFATSKDRYMAVDWEYTYMVFAARLSYHPDFGVKKLDAYATLTLGYYIWSWKVPSGVYKGSYDDGAFYFGGNLGARYFFTEKFGAFLELGYSSLTYATIGLAIKL